MRANPDLELRLLRSSDSLSSEDHGSNTKMGMGESSVINPQPQQRQLTIFYNGRVCVCDVTEFQARAIIFLASKEMDDRMKAPPCTIGSEPEPASPPSIESQLYSPTGLSMKRSLQRFLQKRKHRSLATSPY